MMKIQQDHDFIQQIRLVLQKTNYIFGFRRSKKRKKEKEKKRKKKKKKGRGNE